MSHFTIAQRYKLKFLLQQNVCKTQIAQELKKHIPIYRDELNTDKLRSIYNADFANRKYKKSTIKE
jgi:IS30 family transposase